MAVVCRRRSVTHRALLRAAFPWRLRWVCALVAALLTGFLPAGLPAQTVTGTVVESGAGRPLPGVLISLADEAGAGVVRAIADAAGRFVLHARRRGIYSLHAERMGLEDTVHPNLRLDRGAELRLRVEMAVAPVSLAGIEVGGEQRCSLEPEAGVSVQRVWDVARAALRSNEATEALGIYRYDLIRYRRHLEPATLAVLEETASARPVWSRQPIRSRDLDALLDSGFVVPDPAGTRYYAPDARVLLSDRFLSTHCFTLRDGPDGHLGLAFRPTSDRPSVPDVAGTLWLDRGTARLRWLDVRYINLPRPQSDVDGSSLGARIDFREVADGTWIVSRWRIRMPIIGEWLRVRRVSRYRLIGITEEGGRVSRALRGEKVIFTEPLGVVEGTVHDAADDEPSPASVVLVGTVHTAPVGADGSFRFADVPEGSFQVAVLDHRLAGLDESMPVGSVTVEGGDTVRIDVTRLRPAHVLEDICGDDWRLGSLVVMGRVVQGGSGVGLDDAEVEASWQTAEVDEGRKQPVRVRESSRTRANERGDFRLCGIPSTPRIALEARGEGRAVKIQVDPPTGVLVVKVSLTLPQ